MKDRRYIKLLLSLLDPPVLTKKLAENQWVNVFPRTVHQMFQLERI